MQLVGMILALAGLIYTSCVLLPQVIENIKNHYDK